MNYSSMCKATVLLDPNVPGSWFLREFRSPYRSSIRTSKSLRPKQKQKITFEMITFGHSHKISDAIGWIQEWRNRLFATPYELLALDASNQDLQMRSELVTPEFTLGVDPEDVSPVVTREVFGRVIEDTRPDRVVQPSTRYVTRMCVTDVDRLDVNALEGSTGYEDWLDQYLYKALAPKFSLP